MTTTNRHPSDRFPFRAGLLLLVLLVAVPAWATKLLMPMDWSQRVHLKAYGIAYWTLEADVTVAWLLHYRGGSFLIDH